MSFGRMPKKNKSLEIQEQKLQINEVSISERLREILNIIEREIIRSTTEANILQEISLQKTNKIVTYAAIVGLILTVFFSILILNDFSKTESYKNQLEVANAKTKKLLNDREQLISTVSHDLKTPLSTIVGYSELLGNSDLNVKQKHYNKNIKSSSEYISKLVQDLLDFTKIEAGKIVVEPIPFSLAVVIDEVAKNIQAVYSQKEINLHIDIDPKLSKNIVTDPFRLRQILTNLIGNAYKFTLKGSITIRAKITDANVSISVIDTGIGIKESSQKLVFEEFTQANDGIEKIFGGTGLGLTIAKKMTETLNGTLKLESKFGYGSTFTIQFPLVWASEQFSTQEFKPATLPQEITRQIVLIDDDPNLLALTTEVLKQKNHIIHSFNSAVEALETIPKIDFDCIITDIQMPFLDGFEFVKELTKRPFYKNQPVLAITGRADLDLDVYQKAGFSSVIQKPYSPQILIEKLNHLFDEKPLVTFNYSEKINPQHPYSLEKLKAFLPDDEVALQEVLNSLVKNTQQNLLNFRQFINEKNAENIRELAHRMYPMFQQIEATAIANLLNKLSNETLQWDEIEDINAQLNEKTAILFELFRKNSII